MGASNLAICFLIFNNKINMSTITVETETATTLTQAINNANDVQVDGAWAILKYKEIAYIEK